jgi:hypothetical protein
MDTVILNNIELVLKRLRLFEVVFVVEVSEEIAASIFRPQCAGTSQLNQRTRITEAGFKLAPRPVCRPLLI